MKSLSPAQQRAIRGMVDFVRETAEEVRFTLADSFGKTVYGSSHGSSGLEFLAELTISDITTLRQGGYLKAQVEALSAGWTITQRALDVVDTPSRTGRRKKPFLLLSGTGREKRFFLYLMVAVVGLGIFGVLRITDPGRGLERYGDSVTPIIQRHLDAYDFLGPEGNRVYEQALSPTVTPESLDQLRGLADSVAGNMLQVMEEWAAIPPPPKAQFFHKLVFDAMDLRYQAALNAVAFLDSVGQGGNPDTGRMDLASEQLTNSDLMWTHVIVSSVSLKVDVRR